MTVGLISFGAPIQFPQRGNLNLTSADINREHRYINALKSGQRVSSSSGVTFYQDLDANQYPTEAVNGVSFAVYFPGSTTYVAKWQGSGSITGVSIGSKTDSSSGIWTGGGANGSIVTNGRFTFTVNAATLLSSMTVKGTTINNAVICRLDEEAAYDGGQVFRTDFLNLLAALKPDNLRFMDSQETNRSVLANWDDRKSVDFLTYNSAQYIPGKKVGLITGTNTYTAASYTGMPVSHTHGEIFHGHMENANTSTTVTIDSGGRGAKRVMTEAAIDPATSGTNKATRLLTTTPYSFVFDAFYDKWIAYPDTATSFGHPLEDLVDLCNASGIRGWFNIGVYWTDAFVASFAQYLCDHYEPDIAYFEWGNEIWNNGGAGFPLTLRVAKYGDDTFSGIGGSSGANYSGYYGYRMRQVAAIIRSVFSSNGQSSKPRIILANQGAIGNTVSNITNVIENKRFQNTSFPALTGANAPILHADIVSYALYYGGASIPGYFDSEYTAAGAAVNALKTNVDLYLTGDPGNIATAFQWAKDDFLTASGFLSHAVASDGRFENFNTLAASYGKTVMLYEHNSQFGAPSATWCTAAPISDSTYGGEAGKINQFLLAWMASSYYQDVQAAWLSYFYARSQSTSSSIFAMCTGSQFDGAATKSPWLTFAKLNPTTDLTYGGDTTQTPYKNWDAHVAWNNAH